MKVYDVEEAQAQTKELRERMRGQRYQHYKGGTYRVLDVVCDEVFGFPVVTYESEQFGYVWARPLANFTQHVGSVQRFTWIEPAKIA